MPGRDFGVLCLCFGLVILNLIYISFGKRYIRDLHANTSAKVPPRETTHVPSNTKDPSAHFLAYENCQNDEKMFIKVLRTILWMQVEVCVLYLYQ